jgi:dCTP deaminase
VDININIDDMDFKQLAKSYLVQLAKDGKGCYGIEPEKFYLAPTYEKVGLPTSSQLAARVEGRSSLARLGLVVHMTAPTIHSGYGENNPGIVTLEIYNYGPFVIKVVPGKTSICQLIIEKVASLPTLRGPTKTFTEQSSPKG